MNDDDSYTQGLQTNTEDDQESAHPYDPHDLFSLPPGSPSPAAQSGEEKTCWGSRSSRNMKPGPDQGSLDHGASWVSGGGSKGGSVRSKGKKKTSIFTEKLSPVSSISF